MSNSIINIHISKVMRDALDASAKKKGVSRSKFISDSLLSYLGLSQWPEVHGSLVPACVCVVCGNPLPDGKARYCSYKCSRQGRSQAAVESLRRKRLSQSHSPED